MLLLLLLLRHHGLLLLAHHSCPVLCHATQVAARAAVLLRRAALAACRALRSCCCGACPSHSWRHRWARWLAVSSLVWAAAAANEATRLAVHVALQLLLSLLAQSCTLYATTKQQPWLRKLHTFHPAFSCCTCRCARALPPQPLSLPLTLTSRTFFEMSSPTHPCCVCTPQVWPELRPSDVAPWHGPPLLTDKVARLLQLLDADRRRCIGVKGTTAADEDGAEGQAAAAAQAAAVDAAAADGDDWWACMVFVETKVGAAGATAAAKPRPYTDACRILL